jgi:hypothetical protein
VALHPGLDLLRKIAFFHRYSITALESPKNTGSRWVGTGQASSWPVA